MSSFLYPILKDFTQAFLPLRQSLASKEGFQVFLIRYGWDAQLTDEQMDSIRSAFAIEALLADTTSCLDTLINGIQINQDEVLLQLVDLIADIFEQLWSLSASSDAPFPLNEATFWSELSENLISDLFADYLEITNPILYGFFHFTGVINYEKIRPEGVHRVPFTRTNINFGNLADFFVSPQELFNKTYQWNSSQADFDYRKLFQVLERIFLAFRLPVSVTVPRQEFADLLYDSQQIVPQHIKEIEIPLIEGTAAGDRSYWKIGMVLLPAHDPLKSNGKPSGIALVPLLQGDLNSSLPISKDIALRFSGGFQSGNSILARIYPAKSIVTGTVSDTEVDAAIEIDGNPAEPWVLLGSPDSSRIALSGFKIAFALKGKPSDPEILMSFGTGSDPSNQNDKGWKVIVDLNQADSFIKDSVNKSSFELPFSTNVIWSNKTGFRLNGDASFDIPLPIVINLGAVTLQNTHLRLGKGNRKSSADVIELQVSTELNGRFGPVGFQVDGLGFLFNAISYSKEEIKNLPPGSKAPLFGKLDLEMDFKPPNGAGLSIDEAGFTGGGFLLFDRDKSQYAGMVDLTIVNKIAVKGTGLITTRLPGNEPGFSLLVIITAENFNAIPLPLGFKLTGIGGLLAINRTFDEEALRAGLKNATLDGLLFPVDPIRNASQILNSLNKVFPTARKHHLFGPVFKLGWGTPTLVTAEVAVVLEFGERLRLLLLAQIAAILPKPENELIRLKMDAVGVIDFDQGTAALDATLFDSRLLKKFVLTGDMALRMGWEGQPNFALAVGGLHPAYNPPANFPKLERIAINLAAGDNPRIRCESYFALTANTLQYGSRAELFAAAAGFSIQGEIGYDVLIQIAPFMFLADFIAQLQLKRGSTNLFKVRVEGALAGPRPLHIKAKATFEVLWWDTSINVDVTLLDGEKPPLPEPVAVLPKLLDSLAQPGNWTSQLPAGQRAFVTLRARTGRSGDVLLHPLGSLTVKQGVVPLDMDIARIGPAAPAGARRFTISQASLEGADLKVKPERDFFAPAQFFEMSDEEKLSRPSFEQMPAGVSFGSAQFAFSEREEDCLEVAAIEYETLIVDKQTNVTRPSQTEESFALSASQLARQAGFGAAGASPLRRSGREKYRSVIGKHRIEREGWSIVSTVDMTVQSTPGNQDGRATNYSEAEQALARLKQEQPARAAGLKILRLSEIKAEKEG